MICEYLWQLYPDFGIYGITILSPTIKAFHHFLFKVYQQIVDLTLSSMHYCARYFLLVLIALFCDIVLSCAYALHVFFCMQIYIYIYITIFSTFKVSRQQFMSLYLLFMSF